ncbi:MAG TPA: two-component regulator propeller domain-containing protein [Chitinophagaceae bacterium]|nr:two-component regulator propeller domain-containing protein [Chitinophagaceae bacterium]
MLTKSLIAIFLLAACNISFCQVKNYPFSRIGIQDGLSDNQVVTIFKDSQGYIWFGTQSGLNRYDGYSVKVFRHDDADPASLSDDYIEHIYEGPENKLYIYTPAGGINIYDPETQQFIPQSAAWLQRLGLPKYGLVKIVKADAHFYFVYRDSGIYRFEPGKPARQVWRNVTQGNQVADAVMDSSGALWLSCQDRLLQKINLASGKFSSINIPQQRAARGLYSYKIFIDREDKVWLFAPGFASGLLQFDEHSGKLTNFCQDSGQVKLSNNVVNDVVQDDKGIIWIATDQGGIVLLDEQQMKTVFLVNSDEERSLSQNTVTTLYRDDRGIIWAGTYKQGVCYYQQNMFRFPLYRRQPGLAGSLPYNDVNTFAEDKAGNIWIGTNGGGLIFFNRGANTFTSYRHQAGNANSISSDVVVVLMLSHTGKLWVGTYHGGLDCYEGGRFTHYRHNDTDAASLATDDVYALKEDNNGSLWVGTLGGGLDRLDIDQNKFYHNNTSQQFSLHSDYVSSLAFDKDTNLWVGTAYGIDVLRRNTGKYEYFTRENSGLAGNNVNAVYCGHSGNMWIATRNGLCLMQPGKDTFQVFTVKDGLPSNSVLGVLEDNDHFLWLSTAAGLCKVKVLEENGRVAVECINYDEYDGLQGREFNVNATLRTSGGELAFGGGNGFNLFNPSSIITNSHVPPVVLTGLQLFNKEVLLPASVSRQAELTLQYDQNNFSLQFAALSYINPKKNRYAYQLSGIDKGWVFTDGLNRLATYTNIGPGEYTFRVKASNSDGVWNNQGVTIHIIIQPPFWKTWLAYIIYVLAAFAALYLTRLNIIKKARTKFALANERREALRINELNRMKIKFITNLSHEFRTPLSLILSPTEKLIKNIDNVEPKQLGMLIQRNAKRLLHLVNQLLDFRKMEVNELKLNKSEGDIAGFIKDATDSFCDLAEAKGIILNYKAGVKNLPAFFDNGKVERIMFNLLSNAFKFTSAGGKVEVELIVEEQGEDSALLKLKVSDTGIGIAAELQDKIFESFFQGEAQGPYYNQGSGIGLAITREFVEMQGGSIKVESELGKGSCFTVLLPVTILSGELQEPAAANTGETTAGVAAIDDTEQGDNKLHNNADGKEKKIKILLVEDDDDFRFYLKDNLTPYFTILEAANGQEGWKKTVSSQPDLVVSDVNMPVMNGLDLCRKIKGDNRVGHIPVILLTALSGEKDQLTALSAGANDYISKPFNVEILISRVKNLLQYKGAVVQTFTKRIEVSPNEINIEPGETEEDFMRKAAAILETNISNPDFSVENWCRELHLSRTSLYKKIITCTGMTPIGFIRNFRLKRAAYLLEAGRYNIAEVAYMVGFNNPKYFARYFKEEFGVLPSVYQADKRKKD